MMGSGSRRMSPDEIPPIFYFIMFFMVLICILALVINFIRHPKNKNEPGVVDVYSKMVQARVKGRTGYISNYLDKQKKKENEKQASNTIF